MIGASKILTVSYGTFSCTLEGFDDPFNTMKAIAEYFRDLAAEDRYFGAEPPQPDAAMLHRIAEREIQRRVEARVQDNGVILRAEAQEAAPALAVAAPVSAPEPAPAPAVVPAHQASSVTESVAAKLSQLRAAQAAAAVAAVPAEAGGADAAEALLPEPELAEFLAPIGEAEAEPVEDLAAPVAEAEWTELEPGAPEQAALAPEAEEAPAEAEPAEAEAAAEVEPVEAEATAEPVAPAMDLPEGLADELPEDAARALSDALAGLDDALVAPRAEHSIEDLFPEADSLPDDAADILPEMLDSEPQQAPEDDQLAALIATLSGGEVAEDVTVDAEEAAAAVSDETQAEAPDLVAEGFAAEEIAEEIAGEDADLVVIALPEIADAELAEEVGAALDDSELVLADQPEDDETVLETGDEAAFAAETGDEVGGFDTDDVVAEPAALPAAADLAAEADDVVEELSAEIEIETEIEAQVEALVEFDEIEAAVAPVPEAPEKLQRARARVVRIRRPEAVVAEAPQPDELAAAPAELAEPRRKLEAGADDAALNRLIAQTNSEMEGPEAKRRLSAIAHLKAAVAATVAERLSRGKPASTEAARAEPYRDDLARAVRPARPDAPGLRGDRPAPLVLVSEQRIDRPAAPAAPAQPPAPPAHVSPVRPRRVTSAALAVQTDDEDEDEDEDASNIFADTRGFVDFAERLGVRSLPDLMEAAAAYTASVEGRPHFSRPHLIKHLTAARGVDLPREDSLRTFGRLLREGRIEKIKRGQFAVNEGSRFLTEARKISG